MTPGSADFDRQMYAVAPYLCTRWFRGSWRKYSMTVWTPWCRSGRLSQAGSLSVSGREHCQLMTPWAKCHVTGWGLTWHFCSFPCWCSCQRSLVGTGTSRQSEWPRRCGGRTWARPATGHDAGLRGFRYQSQRKTGTPSAPVSGFSRKKMAQHSCSGPEVSVRWICYSWSCSSWNLSFLQTCLACFPSFCRNSLQRPVNKI